jgi:hypothetical protein
MMLRIGRNSIAMVKKPSFLFSLGNQRGDEFPIFLLSGFRFLGLHRGTGFRFIPLNVVPVKEFAG